MHVPSHLLVGYTLVSPTSKSHMGYPGPGWPSLGRSQRLKEKKKNYEKLRQYTFIKVDEGDKILLLDNFQFHF